MVPYDLCDAYFHGASQDDVDVRRFIILLDDGFSWLVDFDRRPVDEPLSHEEVVLVEPGDLGEDLERVLEVRYPSSPHLPLVGQDPVDLVRTEAVLVRVTFEPLAHGLLERPLHLFLRLDPDCTRAWT